MKHVLLLRHAKSSWKDASLSDHQRPLNKRGKRDAPRMGLLLMDKDIIPDIILCSTAKRARQTVERLLDTCDFSGEVKHIEELYHADYVTYLDLLTELGHEVRRAMIVGHNPEMNYFLQVICDVFEHMPTACIASINFPIEQWTDLNKNAEGTLKDLWKPREVDY